MNEHEVAILCAMAGVRVDAMPTEYAVPGFRGYTKEDLAELHRHGIRPIMGGDGTDPDPKPDLDPPDPTADALTRLAGAVEGMTTAQATQSADIERRINEALAKVAAGEPNTPTKIVTPPANIEVSDRFVDMKGEPWKRGDFELSLMLFEGMGKISAMPRDLRPPEDLVRGYIHHVYETPGPRPAVVDDKGRIVRKLDPAPLLAWATEGKRAMDTAESGFGSQLIGAQYVRDLWQAARNIDSLIGAVREIPMTDPTTYVPVDGEIPEMLFVGESTSASATAYTTSKTPSNRVTLTAKKFTIQQIWSGELDEDSIIAFTPFLREMLNASAAAHLGSAYYNGDETNAATGNINTDDADPTDTKHFLAWDGIRHDWLVTTTAQGKDMAAALDPKEILRARGKLNGADDDVDAAVKTINWGMRAEELRIICTWDDYMNLLDLDEVKTIDKYGPLATIVTGELARLNGMPIVAPSYASKTEADGKASGTETNNTKGQLTVCAPRAYLAGVRRDVQLFFDRIQRTDQFLFELYTRRAFTRFGTVGAAGIYDITV